MTLSLNLEQLASTGLIHSSWVEPLLPLQKRLDRIAGFLQDELDAGRVFLPASENVMRAFQIPFMDVAVVIVGQDPYPTAGHPTGLAFAVSPGTKPLPRSQSNILTELATDLGEPANDRTILANWSHQGVMLLNRVLTVEAGKAGSHRNRGWETVTECALRALDSRPNKPLAAILWGNDAQRASSFIPHSHIILSAHPSPLSAHKGFFGSRPFSRANDYLVLAGVKPINWLSADAPQNFL